MDGAEVSLGWAKNALEKQTCMYHKQTGAIGTVMEVFDPAVNPWANVPHAVVRMSDGNTLIANPNAFKTITRQELLFLEQTQHTMREMMYALAQIAKESTLEPDEFVFVLQLVLSRQLAALKEKTT